MTTVTLPFDYHKYQQFETIVNLQQQILQEQMKSDPNVEKLDTLRADLYIAQEEYTYDHWDTEMNLGSQCFQNSDTVTFLPFTFQTKRFWRKE